MKSGLGVGRGQKSGAARIGRVRGARKSPGPPPSAQTSPKPTLPISAHPKWGEHTGCQGRPERRHAMPADRVEVGDDASTMIQVCCEVSAALHFAPAAASAAFLELRPRNGRARSRPRRPKARCPGAAETTPRRASARAPVRSASAPTPCRHRLAARCLSPQLTA